jgi:hypothetical protein
VLGVRKPEAYICDAGLDDSVYVIGPYVSPCGGCDAIQPYFLIPELVDKYAARGHVIFEGMLVSSTYGSVGASLEKYGKEAVLLFLDTPLETCLEYVRKRRNARGVEKPLNEKNTRNKYEQIAWFRKRMKEKGESKLTFLETSAEAAVPFMLKLLQGGVPSG